MNQDLAGIRFHQAKNQFDGHTFTLAAAATDNCCHARHNAETNPFKHLMYIAIGIHKGLMHINELDNGVFHNSIAVIR